MRNFCSNTAWAQATRYTQYTVFCSYLRHAYPSVRPVDRVTDTPFNGECDLTRGQTFLSRQDDLQARRGVPARETLSKQQRSVDDQMHRSGGGRAPRMGTSDRGHRHEQPQADTHQERGHKSHSQSRPSAFERRFESSSHAGGRRRLKGQVKHLYRLVEASLKGLDRNVVKKAGMMTLSSFRSSCPTVWSLTACRLDVPGMNVEQKGEHNIRPNCDQRKGIAASCFSVDVLEYHIISFSICPFLLSRTFCSSGLWNGTHS